MDAHDRKVLDAFVGKGFPQTPIEGTLSDYNRRELLKDAGGQWNPEKKVWTAKTLAIFQGMIETNVWKPTGLSDHLLRPAIDAFRAIEMARDRAAAESVRRVPLSLEEHEKRKRKSLGVEKDEEDVLHWLLTEYGVDEDQVRKSAHNPALGPRSGMSDALRFKTAILSQRENGVRIFPDAFFFFNFEVRRNRIHAALYMDASAQPGDPDHNFEELLKATEHRPLSDDELWQLRKAKDLPVLYAFVLHDVRERRNCTLPHTWPDDLPPPL